MMTDIRCRRSKPCPPVPSGVSSSSSYPRAGADLGEELGEDLGLSQGRCAGCAGGTGRPLPRCWRSSTATSPRLSAGKDKSSRTGLFYVGSFCGEVHPCDTAGVAGDVNLMRGGHGRGALGRLGRGLGGAGLSVVPAAGGGRRVDGVVGLRLGGKRLDRKLGRGQRLRVEALGNIVALAA